MQYIILAGALKNVGDFLIAKRTRELIEYYKPNAKILEFSRFEDLTNKLDVVNQSKAVILAGGPGYLPNMYPKTFRLVPNLSDIKVPIIALGMGWYGRVGDDLDLNSYRFTKESHKLLNRLVNDFPYLGVRDYLTEEVLNKQGFANTMMTGCPAWYDIEYINGKRTINANEVKSIAFSTPASYRYYEQAIKVMALIKKEFPNAKLCCTFHRGVNADKYTKKTRAKFFNALKDHAKKLGFECFDLSYDANNMEIYDRYDLHIGYRVHAHIYCLSHFRKSILLEEDGRGRGANEALGTRSLSCIKRIIIPKKCFMLRCISSLANKMVIADNSVVSALENYIKELKDNNYIQIEKGFATIKEKQKIMEQFIKMIP